MSRVREAPIRGATGAAVRLTITTTPGKNLPVL